MSMSSVHRRHLRALLGVRPARGDRIERRFLTRFDLMLGRRRLRLDVKTGSGTIMLLSLMRRIIPARLRGSRRQRELRTLVTQVISQATTDMNGRYEQTALMLHRLHDLAVSGHIPRMTSQELQHQLNEMRNAVVPESSTALKSEPALVDAAGSPSA